VLAVVFSGALAPGNAMAGADKPAGLTADLDGKSLDLVEVGDWYCHDFEYPAIHCFSDPEELEADVSETLAVTAVVYVTVYDFTSLQGSYMHMSQDYTVLAWVGWNDRISSLRGRNNEDGHFYVDWFNGGAIWGFCCNQQFASLGSYDNAFSSVHRN
jgi:hypothetical protein